VHSYTSEEEGLMRLALKEAAQAALAGEVPAGAIVLNGEGEIVAVGRNRVIGLSDPTAHAETLAIREASSKVGNYRLTGFTLFSTLEPCAMCLMAAVHARLDTIIYGAREPRWGAAGSLVDLASLPGLNHRLTLKGGLLADECAAIISSFFKHKRAAGRR